VSVVASSMMSCDYDTTESNITAIFRVTFPTSHNYDSGEIYRFGQISSEQI